MIEPSEDDLERLISSWPFGLNKGYGQTDFAPGWKFQFDEVANNAYKAIGVDQQGNRIEEVAFSPVDVIRAIIQRARRISFPSTLLDKIRKKLLYS